MIAFDASPWGLGWLLYINGELVAYVCDALTELDEARFGHVIGSDRGQQCWECLAVLVCLRAWSKYWRSGRFTIGFGGDNVTALTMAMKYKASSSGVRTIAREVALDLTHSPFPPTVYEHVPGIVNQTADILSRRYDPAKAASWKLPSTLAAATRTRLPFRGSSYYHYAAA